MTGISTFAIVGLLSNNLCFSWFYQATAPRQALPLRGVTLFCIQPAWSLFLGHIGPDLCLESEIKIHWGGWHRINRVCSTHIIGSCFHLHSAVLLSQAGTARFSPWAGEEPKAVQCPQLSAEARRLQTCEGSSATTELPCVRLQSRMAETTCLLKLSFLFQLLVFSVWVLSYFPEYCWKTPRL